MAARPTPESYMPEFIDLAAAKKLQDDVVALDELLKIGTAITAYCAEDVAARFGAHNAYFHHDVWKLFNQWRSLARHVLKRDKDLFEEELHSFEESGVHSSPLMREDPDFDSTYSIGLLQDIQIETSRRMATLRVARKKANEDKIQRIAKQEPAEYDEDSGRLYVAGEVVQIGVRGGKATLECRMLGILFRKPGIAMPCDEFWAEWKSEPEEDYTDSSWHAMVAAARRINDKIAPFVNHGSLIEYSKDEINISKSYVKLRNLS